MHIYDVCYNESLCGLKTYKDLPGICESTAVRDITKISVQGVFMQIIVIPF